MPQQLTTLKASVHLFPIHPTHVYNRYLAQPISQLADGYHNAQWINLEDSIQYNTKQEYLKRYYEKNEITNKFKLLGQYYRFHFEAPRLFMEAITRIMENNVDEKRAIEYLIVTKEMNNNQSQNNTAANTCRTIEDHQKLIKDVELSYSDFEDKPVRKQIIGLRKCEKQQKNKENCEIRQKMQREMNRVNSMHYKEPLLIFKPKTLNKNKNDSKNIKNMENDVKTRKNKNEKNKKNYSINKKQIGEKCKTMAKTDNNQTHVSNQKLSRSKSKTQLHTIATKRFDANNNNSTKNSVCQSYKNLRSGNTSHQNSIAKSVSKKEILSDQRNIGSNLSKKVFKTDLKEESDDPNDKKLKIKPSEHQNMVNYRTDPQLIKPSPSSKQKTCRMETVQLKLNPSISQKKMFNRALQLKKKKT